MSTEASVVWLVEDNKLHAKMVEQAFEDSVVRVFDNGASLLEHIASQTSVCDVVVLDWKLPDMSGLDVCRFLRASHDEIHLPILMLTVQGNKSDIVEGLRAGANDYLTKPFDAMELRARMATLLRVKRLNEERERAETDRERYRELMLAMIGHDLRQPLSAISMGTDTLMLRENTTAVDGRLLARIKASSERMARMIEQVLDFTRSRFGGIALKKQLCDLERIVLQCVEEFELAAPECLVEVDVRARSQGLWDPDRLSQVIGNILANARSHGAKGTPVQIAVALEGAVTVVNINNQGPPIPSALMSSIFDPFRRGEEQGPRAKGLGLGLYIARQIVAAHGGDIDVVSDEQHGTTFSIHLPLTHEG